MLPHESLDAMLNACFFAVGQGVGPDKTADYEVIVWWRDRYLQKFDVAVNVTGNSWKDDRDRVLAVSRWLGHRARVHAGERAIIDVDAGVRASAEIESGCRMSRERSM